ncbi:MAG: PKD domain-containing protein [Vicingaceae bacterium]|nr:PKD domain-containing protein [Vicingaceae bacterium]
MKFKCFFIFLGLLLTTSAFSQITPPAGFGNNIILWLSPDSSVFEATNNTAELNDRVVEWHDISGGGYVFSNTGGGVRPRLVSYQGKNMLDFVNGDYIENLPIAAAINGLDEFSIYIVIKSDDITNNDKGFLDSENPDGADEIICMRYDASGANTGRTNLIKCGMQGNTANNQVESQSNTQTNSLQCLTLTWKQGEQINLYIDGVLNESSVNTVNSLMSGVQKILLGKGPKDTGNNSGWNGRIGTTIFYNKKMSPDTVSLISGDLKSIQSVQSGNWNNPTTWDCNCNPPNNAFVKINNSHTVTLTQNETVNNVIIASGGTLDLSTNNRNLSLRRNFTNHGSLIASSEEVIFNGNSEQLIDGSGTTNFFNLTVNNNAGVKVTDGNINVQGTIDLQAGCLETDNRITLLSNASGTARIGEIPSGACITGNITMQRYIDAGSTDWRFLTSAVGSTTLADFNDDFITSGFIGSDFPNWPSASNPWPSIYFYDETTSGIQDNGFVAATNTTNSVGVGEGLWVWSGDTITGTQPFTIDMNGAPNVGDINLPVTYTNSGLPAEDGWNMVGNPYPSSLDWDSPNITKTNINNAIYIWNPDIQQFGSYVGGIGTNGASNNIASSQAFWVQATSPSPLVRVTESSKTTVDGAFLKPSIIQPFRINASNNNGSDEIAINLEPNSTNSFDAEFDAEKMTSANTNLPRLSTIIGTQEYSINQFPQQEINLPVKITCGLSGFTSIKFENIAALGNTRCLMFEDLANNISYDLNSIDSINLYINNTTDSARFLLRIGASYAINSDDPTCYGNTDGAIKYTLNSANPYDIIWRNSNNAIIANSNNVVGSDSLSNIASGTYSIEINDAYCGNSIDTVTITMPLEITSDYTTTNDTILLGNAFTPNNTSINATSYLWSFGDGNTSTLANPSHTYNQIGTYIADLKAMQNATCFKNYNKSITVIANATGIDELNNNEVKTYITNNVLTVELNNSNYKTITIRNALGQLIHNSSLQNSLFTFDLTDYSNGVYLITLTDNTDKFTTTKLVYSKQ